MGGRWSGRLRGPRTHLVEKSLRLDLADLRRAGLFQLAPGDRILIEFQMVTGHGDVVRIEPHFSTSPYLDVSYQTHRSPYTEQIRVDLQATTPEYGGVRWWFCCPGCTTRCRILYCPHWTREFRCRVCHQLNYLSQHETSGQRTLRRSQETIRQLQECSTRLLACPSWKEWDHYLFLLNKWQEQLRDI